MMRSCRRRPGSTRLVVSSTARYSSLLLLLLGLLLLRDGLTNAELASDYRTDFSETVLIDGLASPTDLSFSPDGSDLALVTEQAGQIYAVTNLASPESDEDAVVKWKVGNVYDRMCHNGSRGLVGIAFHPSFSLSTLNPDGMWAYTFYTVDSGDCFTGKWDLDDIEGTINRLSRFPIVADDDDDGRITLDERNEEILLETAVQMSHNHNGGDIKFGPDGLLYLSLGDGLTNKLRNDDGLPYEQALDTLFGKMIRLTPDGGIPDTNPYAASGVFCGKNGGYSGSRKKPCAEVFASGLRNPFRFAFDPNHKESEPRFWINDVGGSTFERIVEGKSGANYGYPTIKGPCSAELESGNKCETPQELGFEPSVHWYGHDSELGACITAGAFIPADIGWPSEFDGSYVFGEYKWGGIYRIAPGGKGCPASECKVPVSDYQSTNTDFSDATAVVSMSFGPYGDGSGSPQALYFLTRGAGRGSNERGRPEGLVRIAYLGAQEVSNDRPVAVVDTDGTGGSTIGFNPLTIRFDGSRSTDPEGGTLSYAWDFNGDGSIDSTSPQDTFVYKTPGVFEATLTVTDEGGATDQRIVDVVVDNAPPNPVIESPSLGLEFAIGDTVLLIGSATDSEDGNLPASSLSWEVREHHGDHFHTVVEPRAGSEVSIIIPAPLEDGSVQSSTLQAVLTATDSRGLSSTAVRTLRRAGVQVAEEEEEIEDIPAAAADSDSQDEEEDKAAMTVSSDADTGIAKLLDFSIVVDLKGSMRRLMGDDAKPSSVFTFLDQNLERLLAESMRNELNTLRKSSGLAKPTDVDLVRKSRKVHDGEQRYEASFGGTVSFKKRQEEQRLPTSFDVQSMQVQALSRVGDQLIYDIEESVPGTSVESVVTDVVRGAAPCSIVGEKARSCGAVNPIWANECCLGYTCSGKHCVEDPTYVEYYEGGDSACSIMGEKARSCGATNSIWANECCPGYTCRGKHCVEDPTYVEYYEGGDSAKTQSEEVGTSSNTATIILLTCLIAAGIGIAAIAFGVVRSRRTRPTKKGETLDRADDPNQSGETYGDLIE